MTPRITAQFEVSALVREVNAAGGFAVVVARGERETGTILVVLTQAGANQRAYERMPDLDGNRHWHCARRADSVTTDSFADYLDRRQKQDRDLWIVELDIANAERFIGLPATDG